MMTVQQLIDQLTALTPEQKALPVYFGTLDEEYFFSPRHAPEVDQIEHYDEEKGFPVPLDVVVIYSDERDE